MAIKMVVNGIEITASPAEAAAFLRELEAAGPVKPLAGKPPKVAAPTGPSEGLLRTAKFMQFMASTSLPGATSADVAQALGIKEKGIGSALTVFGRELKALGFPDMPKVLQRVRQPDGSRYWCPGEDFPAAAEAVRRAVPSGPGVT